MPERHQVVQFLVEKIEEMKKEHVADLMRANQLEELNKISARLDLSLLPDFVENNFLKLSMEELPEDSLLESVFILRHVGFSDDEVFSDWHDFKATLKNTGKDLECQIAELMDLYNICCLTLEEILTGKIEDDDEDEDEDTDDD